MLLNVSHDPKQIYLKVITYCTEVALDIRLLWYGKASHTILEGLGAPKPEWSWVNSSNAERGNIASFLHCGIHKPQELNHGREASTMNATIDTVFQASMDYWLKHQHFPFLRDYADSRNSMKLFCSVGNRGNEMCSSSRVCLLKG